MTLLQVKFVHHKVAPFVSYASYRLLGGACWQWCSWRHWRRHTPTPHGPPCWEIWTVSCLLVGRCACFCWASLPSPIKENSSSKWFSWVDNDTGSSSRIVKAYLSPCNVGEWVSFCLTGDNQLSTSLLPVLPSRNHQKFGWVLYIAKHHVILMQIDDVIN